MEELMLAEAFLDYCGELQQGFAVLFFNYQVKNTGRAS